MPGISLLIDVDAPRFTCLAATNDYIKNAQKKSNEVIGKGLFDVFLSGPNDPQFTAKDNLIFSFTNVIETKKTHEVPVQRYDVANQDGIFFERYWTATNKPVLDEMGNVIYIIHTATEVTEKVMAAKRDEQMETLQQAYKLLMQVPFSIFILKGPHLIIHLANDPSLKMWGKTTDVIGKPLLQVLPELKGQQHLDLLHRVMTSGMSYTVYESPVQLIKNGSETPSYLNFSFHPYFDEDKSKPTGVLVFCNDVTEKVTADKQSAKSEEQLRIALEGGELGTFDFNPQTGILLWSAKTKELFGLPPDAPVNYETYINSIHPDDRKNSQTIAQQRQSLLKGGFYELEYRAIGISDGLTRWIRSKGKATYNSEGMPVRYTGVVHDITKRKEAEQALKQSEQRFRSLVESAPFPIGVYVGREMRIELVNDSILKTWDRSRDVIGKNYADVCQN